VDCSLYSTCDINDLKQGHGYVTLDVQDVDASVLRPMVSASWTPVLARIRNASLCAPNASFFMYEQPELDHGWMQGCAGFEEMRLSPSSEKLAEVRRRRQL